MIQSNLFGIVMVSADSDGIAEIARKSRDDVPLMHSDVTSDDYADTADVLMKVLNEYNKRGKEYKVFCCIYPTAPFVTAEMRIKSMKLLKWRMYLM